MKEAAKATETFSASIHDWVVKQRTTIIGTPMEQFKVAQDDAFSTYRLAMAGDLKSINKLTSSADTYIAKIQQLYGNSDIGQRMMNEVVAAVAEAPQSQTVQDAVNAGTDKLDTTLKSLPESFAEAVKRVLYTPIGTGEAPGASVDISTAVADASFAAISATLDRNPQLLSAFGKAFPQASKDQLVDGISSASRGEITDFLATHTDILTGIQTAFNDYNKLAGAAPFGVGQVGSRSATAEELLALSAPATTSISAPSAVSPVSTVRSVTEEQPTQKAAKANELQEIKTLLSNVVKELTELRKDERLATEAIIDANFVANGMASDRITDATREQTVNLVYSSKVSVGIA
jgi:hypothetical protein